MISLQRIGLSMLFLTAIIQTTRVTAQVTEREVPAAWKGLVEGGRFQDLFLSMPEGTLSADTWGSEGVRPRYVDNGVEDRETSYWGGNILQTPDGTYHLFVCGWPESSPRGHMTWGQSTVYRATSTELSGPYTVQDTIGKGHNPEAFKLDDGRIVVYVIDGYYLADSVNGTWQYGKFDFDPRDRKIIEGLSNLTFAQRQDGSYLMLCRGGGVWVSQTGLSTYYQLTDKSIYPPVEGRFEDPLIWRDSVQYHMIVNDWLGRIAYYQRSKDGVHWVTEPGEAYAPGIAFHEDGRREDWFKYERIKVFQDEYGRAIQMNFAVIDTLKNEDKASDNHSSKNITIPLNKGLLLSVLNSEPINTETAAIQVKIQAEEGFDPQQDIDVDALRFGSYLEVNYGRGSKAIGTERSGVDLIVIFDGKASGITADEFAPKLIGKDKKGKLLFGYAKLPTVSDKTALLSARKPVYQASSQMLELRVENFGLLTSKSNRVEVYSGGNLIASGIVPSLKPYGSVTLELPSKVIPLAEDMSDYNIVFQDK